MAHGSIPGHRGQPPVSPARGCGQDPGRVPPRLEAAKTVKDGEAQSIDYDSHRRPPDGRRAGKR